MFHLDFHYGNMSWEKVTKKMPRVAATIYREAKTAPELAVFAQTAALWAIDLLLSAKMKSRMRSRRDREEGENEETYVPDARIIDQAAVTAVPEINVAHTFDVRERDTNRIVNTEVGNSQRHPDTSQYIESPERAISSGVSPQPVQSGRRGVKRARARGTHGIQR